VDGWCRVGWSTALARFKFENKSRIKHPQVCALFVFCGWFRVGWGLGLVGLRVQGSVGWLAHGWWVRGGGSKNQL